MKELSKKKKQIIRQLNLLPYSVEFCEDWLNRPRYNIVTNAPCALQQLAVEVFESVVHQIAEKGLKRTNEEYTITASVTVGDTEYVLAELTDQSKGQMYVT